MEEERYPYGSMEHRAQKWISCYCDCLKQHLLAVPRSLWESLQGSYCSLVRSLPDQPLGRAEAVSLCLSMGVFNLSQAWLCEPAPDLSP